MKRKRDFRPYLHDVVDSIARIQRYAEGVTFRDFLRDEMLQDAIIRRITIIGEAVGRLPESITSKYTSIPWRDIKDMRNKLVHEYGRVDLELVWEVVLTEIPILARDLRGVMKDFKAGEVDP